MSSSFFFWIGESRCCISRPNIVFCRMVRHSNKLSFWNIYPMRPVGCVISVPSRYMLPDDGFKSPAIKDSSVDLPHPLGPTMLMNSPSSTDREKSLTASVSPFNVWYLMERFLISSLEPVTITPSFWSVSFRDDACYLGTHLLQIKA